MAKGNSVRMVRACEGAHSDFVREKKTAVFHIGKDRSKSRKRKNRKRK